MSEKTTCECGLSINHLHYPRHLVGGTHINRMAKIEKDTLMQMNASAALPAQGRRARGAATKTKATSEADAIREEARARLAERGIELGHADPTIQNDTDYSKAIAEGRERAAKEAAADATFAQQIAHNTAMRPAEIREDYERDQVPEKPDDSEDFANLIANRSAANTPGVIDMSARDGADSPTSGSFDATTAADREERPILLTSNSTSVQEQRRAIDAHDDSMQEFVAEADDYSLLVGDQAFKANAVFDWARNPRSSHRFRFTRWYYRAGVILDFFTSANDHHKLEVAEKGRAIAEHNAQVPKEFQVGYIPLIVNTELSPEVVRRARGLKMEAREIFDFGKMRDTGRLRPQLIDGVLTMVQG